MNARTDALPEWCPWCGSHADTTGGGTHVIDEQNVEQRVGLRCTVCKHEFLVTWSEFDGA